MDLLGKKLGFEPNRFEVDTETFLSDLYQYFESVHQFDNLGEVGYSSKQIQKARERQVSIQKLLKSKAVFRNQITYIKMYAKNIVPFDEYSQEYSQSNITRILNFLLSVDVISYLLTLGEVTYDTKRDWFRSEFDVLFYIFMSSDFTITYFLHEMVDFCKKKYDSQEYAENKGAYEEYIKTLDEFFNRCYITIENIGAQGVLSGIQTQTDIANNTNYNMVKKELSERDGNLHILFSIPGIGDNIRKYAVGPESQSKIEWRSKMKMRQRKFVAEMQRKFAEMQRKNYAATKIQSMQRMVSAKKRAKRANREKTANRERAAKTASATGGNRKSNPTRKNKK